LAEERPEQQPTYNVLKTWAFDDWGLYGRGDELLARALAAGTPELADARAADLDLDLTLAVAPAPGRQTLLRAADGDLRMDDVVLTVGRLADIDRTTAEEWSA